MSGVPKTLDDAVQEAKIAAQKAFQAGYNLVQVELVVPEIALQAQSLAEEFISVLTDLGYSPKILFPDTGAAALARRDWGETPYKIDDLGSRVMAVERKVDPEDEAFLLVSPSATEIEKVEKLCNLAGDRPVLLLIPQLEDVAIVGIGYAARQIRDRFISKLHSAYYLKPLEDVMIIRNFPQPWQVWLDSESGYQLVSEQPQKPMGDDLDRLIAKATGDLSAEQNEAPAAKKPNLFGSLQKFLRALSQ